jgi:periplasmic protein TonB
MKINNNTYYQPPAAPILSAKVFVAAGLFTLAIFLLLPFSDFLMRSRKRYLLRDANTVAVTKPAPQPPPIYRTRKRKSRTMPQLTSAERKLPPRRIAAGLALEITPGFGDFSLAFNLNPTSGEEGLIFQLNEVDTPPQPLVQMHPLYPMAAKAKGIEGVVVLLFTVQVDGTVDSVEVSSSTPEYIFDAAAKNAVGRWHFKPGIKNGEPVATRVSVPLRFELEKRR